jgi:superfamily II DNA helicase RecQ
VNGFREKQEEIVFHLLQGRDCFVLMPTGAGKSLCFQLPSLLFPGITIVISPLIALMENQVKLLKDIGLNAVLYICTLTKQEKQQVVAELESSSCKIKLLYVTPELLATDFKAKVLKPMHQRGAISLVAVDEAHCISSWGISLQGIVFLFKTAFCFCFLHLCFFFFLQSFL